MDLNALFDWLLVMAGFLFFLAAAGFVADRLPTPRRPWRDQ